MAALLLGAVLLGFVPACGQQGLELVEQIGAAQDHLTYQGVRVYRSSYGGIEEWSREKITRSSDGRFLLELLELNGNSPATRADPEFKRRFELLAEMYRTGLGRRIVLERDFRLRFRELIYQNYRLEVDTGRESFLGRPSAVARLLPREGREDRPCWRVRIDLETGLVLAYQEIELGGGISASMSYESIDYDPSLAGVDFPDYESIPRQELESTKAAKESVSFSLFEPEWLPEGFALVAVQHLEVTVDGEQEQVVSFTYSDGIIEIILFQSRPLDEDPFPDKSQGEEPYEVSFFEHGLLKLAEFRIGDTYCHLAGKVSRDAFTTLIESFAEVE